MAELRPDCAHGAEDGRESVRAVALQGRSLFARQPFKTSELGVHLVESYRIDVLSLEHVAPESIILYLASLHGTWFSPTVVVSPKLVNSMIVAKSTWYSVSQFLISLVTCSPKSFEVFQCGFHSRRVTDPEAEGAAEAMLTQQAKPVPVQREGGWRGRSSCVAVVVVRQSLPARPTIVLNGRSPFIMAPLVLGGERRWRIEERRF